MALVLAKRGEQEEKERKRKRQQTFDDIRIQYAPRYWFDTTIAKEKDPNALQVVTRIPTLADFQEGRREQEIQERKEKREATHSERRNKAYQLKIKEILREIYDKSKPDTFMIWDDQPRRAFLHLEDVRKIFSFLKKEVHSSDISKPMRKDIETYLREIQKEQGIGDEAMKIIFYSLNVMFHYRQYFFNFLPRLLALWNAALQDGVQMSQDLRETFEDFKDYGFPLFIVRTLPIYLDEYLAMNSYLDDNPNRVYFIEEVNDYVRSLSTKA